MAEREDRKGRPLCMTLASPGCRQSEALALGWTAFLGYDFLPLIEALLDPSLG